MNFQAITITTVTKSDTDFQESEGHPDLKSKGKPKTSKASEKVSKKGRKRGPGGSKVAKTKKRKRLTSSEVADILLAKNIKTVTELQALAYTQKREGKEDLMDFIIGRSRKAVSELLETTWEIKEAGEKIARAHKSRVNILQEPGNEECLCATKEEWLECARQVPQSNDIEERTFGRAIMTALEKGRGKYNDYRTCKLCEDIPFKAAKCNLQLFSVTRLRVALRGLVYRTQNVFF